MKDPLDAMSFTRMNSLLSGREEISILELKGIAKAAIAKRAEARFFMSASYRQSDDASDVISKLDEEIDALESEIEAHDDIGEKLDEIKALLALKSDIKELKEANSEEIQTVTL